MSTASATTEYAQALRSNLDFTIMYLHRLCDDMACEDMACEDMASQSEGVVNHPAWCLGHLSIAMAGAQAMLGKEHPAPDGWGETFGAGSNPTHVRDDYPKKDVLLAEIDRQHAALGEAIDSVTPEQLAAETPFDFLRDLFPTVRDALMFMSVGHSQLHCGQIASWRTANDLPRAIA